MEREEEIRAGLLARYYLFGLFLKCNPDDPLASDPSVLREMIALAEAVGDPDEILPDLVTGLRYLELQELGKDSAEMRHASRAMVPLLKKSGADVDDLEYALTISETLAAGREDYQRGVGEIGNLLAAFETLSETERPDAERLIDRRFNQVEAVPCQTKRKLRALQRQMFPQRVAVKQIRLHRAPPALKRRRSAHRAHVGAGSDGDGDSDGDSDGPPGDSRRPELHRRGTSGSLLGACGVAPARRGRPRDLSSTACSEARASCFSSGLGPVREVHPLRSSRSRGILAAALTTPPLSGSVLQSGRTGS